jgi:hypothetical protein
MIDVQAVLREVPAVGTFRSVAALHALTDRLRSDCGFSVREAGKSAGGQPIHHVRFGQGSLKALFVGFPDANEPIGGVTAFMLLSLLAARNRTLTGADVEWHVIPCIDPDGALLNEGWSQQPFELERYLRHFHRPAAQDQVDCSFPIHYKCLSFDAPIPETRVLMEVIEQVRPDFYYSLHNNSGAMGTWLLLNRDIGPPYHEQLQRLLADAGMPIQVSAPFGGLLDRFANGIYENVNTRKIYDRLEQIVPAPEQVLQRGAMSFDYVAELNPSVLSFVAELPYVRHPALGSTRAAGENLRWLKLQVDAENKFLTATILEEWAKVQDEVAQDNAFHRKMVSDLISVKERLPEGLPFWPRKTRDTLFNPAYAKDASEAERFEVYMLERFFVLCHSYEFVRLLDSSQPTPAIVRAKERVEREFSRALAQLDEALDLRAFQPFAPSEIAKVQLGAGLIVLNSLL